jgi:transcriptional regulator with XRE-family HTH domain
MDELTDRTAQGRRIAQARRRTGLSQRGFALQIGRSESLISKLEQGERELNDLRLARAIADFSGVRMAWLLGLDDGPALPTSGQSGPAHAETTITTTVASRSAEEEWTEMLRRMFVLGGLTATLAGSTVDAIIASGATASGGSVSSDTTEDLRVVSRSYRSAYRSVPAARLLPAAQDHMQLALALRPGLQPPPVRRELLMVAGEMAALSAALLGINLDRYREAVPHLDLAYRVARETADVELETVVLGCQSFYAAYGLKDPRLGLDFAEAAVTTSHSGATRTTRGWVAAVASERYAALGDEDACRRRLLEARAALEQPEDGRPWSGIGGFDGAKLIAYEGGDLMRLGRFGEAVSVLDTALDSLDPALHRHRCTALIDRAEAHRAAGEVDAACDDARDALSIALTTQHIDTIQRVERLARDGLRTRSAAARRLWNDALIARASMAEAKA